MFAYRGALCAWLSYINAGGKLELIQIYFTASKKQTLVAGNVKLELISRLMAFAIHSFLAAFFGGLIFEGLKAQIHSTEPPYRWVWQTLWYTFGAFVFAGCSILRSSLPHTTWITRRCADVVDQVQAVMNGEAGILNTQVVFSIN